MTNDASNRIERELSALRDGLLRGRPRALRPDEGDEAFQQHKLLAAAIHRAAKLDQLKRESETDAWVRYISSHYPAGRNDPTAARLLFGDWRTSLLKDNTPGPGIAITHGQSSIHWQRDERGRLCLNLEDAWDDYAVSVTSFVEHLGRSPRRKIVLKRFKQQHWVVEPFVPAAGMIAGATVMDMPLSASFSNSTTSITLSGVAPARSVTASGSPDEHDPKPST